MENLIPEEQQKIAELPEELQQYRETFPNVLIQLVRAQEAGSLPAGYWPETIEIYLNGADSAALIIDNDEALQGKLAELVARESACVVEMDGVARYVAISGRVLLNQIESLILPDVLFSPVSQAHMLIGLASPTHKPKIMED